MILMKLGGINVDNKVISKYKITYQKLDGSGTKRNIQGTMRRKVIANKITIDSETLSELTEDTIRPILNYLTQDTMTAEIYDIKSGTYKTINCYSVIPELEISYIEGSKIYFAPFKIGLIEL